jgi:glycosyltransferase involved in cell wall biosynthesis
MRIVINGMFWSRQTVGTGQYLHGLLDALPRVAPEHEYIVLLPASPDQRPNGHDISCSDRRLTSDGHARGAHRRPEKGDPLGASPKPPIFTLDPSFAVRGGTIYRALTSFVVVRTPFDGQSKNLAKLWFEQIGVPLAAARLRADLLHVPYFAPPLLASAPVVATILDLIPLLLPEYRGSAAVRAYMRLAVLATRRAAHVIAISEDSRADIITHLGIAPALVTTVPLAAGPQYRPLDREQAAACVAERYGLRGPFIYYVGGLDARKNVETLVRAFGRLRRVGGPPATLAIAGRALGADERLFPDLDAQITSERMAPWVRRLDVPHADNPLLYATATAFAYPSRYEGFGMPPLEAMACGTPTVVADTSSLPEVVGGAALRVPPEDVSGWVTALWRLLGDRVLREELRRRGLERAAAFSYERVARATAEVYRRVIVL